MGLILRQGFLIAAKDTRIFVRDRFAVAFALLFPFLFIIGFSVALGDIGPEDEQLLLTVSTREASGISREIVDALVGGDAPIARERPFREAERLFDEGRLRGYIAFPEDFTARVMAGEPAVIDVFVAENSPAREAALRGLANALAGRIANAQIAARTVVELGGAGGVSAVDAAVALASADSLVVFETERVGDVKPFNATNFTLSGYLTMFVFFTAALSAEAIARERERHTLERLMANGVRRGSVIVGKYLAALYVGLTQIAVLWGVGLLVFNIDLGAAPAAVILISVLMVGASAGFGVMLGSLVRTVRSASSVGVLASLVMAPLGGSWWPLFIVPSWMQSLGKIAPHGWANTAFNKAMLFGAEAGDLIPEMVALVVFGAAFVSIALFRFRLAPTA